MLGVGLGFTAMVILVGLGLVSLFDAYPLTYEVLRVASLAYLLFLAWKIATAARPRGDDPAGKPGTPMTFIQAVLFQWVNPKAWTMALTALSVYAPSQGVAAVALVAAVFGLVNLPCITAWTLLGLQLQQLLTSQRRLVAFNLSMALLLVLSLYPVLLP